MSFSDRSISKYLNYDDKIKCPWDTTQNNAKSQLKDNSAEKSYESAFLFTNAYGSDDDFQTNYEIENEEKDENSSDELGIHGIERNNDGNIFDF